MISALAEQSKNTFHELRAYPGALFSENNQVCRIDNIEITDAAILNSLRTLQDAFNQEGMGTLLIFGSIQDVIELKSISVADIMDETLSIVLTKSNTETWSYFVTIDGFITMLKNESFMAQARSLWVAEPFSSFESRTTQFSEWGGPHDYLPLDDVWERPRKLVRDHTHEKTVEDLAPWLLAQKPEKGSLVFAAWRSESSKRLVFTLPAEIRRIGEDHKVVLKGPRSTPISLADTSRTWEEAIYPVLHDAVSWVYSTPRDAESKFIFLNNHLSLDWRDGFFWPDGLLQVLESSLTSARESFAFHLQDQSKDALKSLGDLRKGLQEEVAKTHQATRDLLGSLWRDLAIAGVVLALRSPIAPGGMIPEVARYITLATATLLTISLIVTVLSNWRFNRLSESSRNQWRYKLYAFVSNEDWKRLVDDPICSGRRTYRGVLAAVSIIYLVVIYYLINLSSNYPGLASALRFRRTRSEGLS